MALCLRSGLIVHMSLWESYKGGNEAFVLYLNLEIKIPVVIFHFGTESAPNHFVPPVLSSIGIRLEESLE